MPEIQKVRWNHDAMIDYMLANPDQTQGEIAAVFGYTQSWLSIIVNSDAFQERLAERRQEVVDPVLRATVEDRFKALAARSAEVLLEKLDAAPSEKTALAALEITSRALGYGAKGPQTAVQVTFAPVAVVPAKELSSEAWMQSYAPRAAPLTVENVEASGQG
jgi:hypothetical protein